MFIKKKKWLKKGKNNRGKKYIFIEKLLHIVNLVKNKEKHIIKKDKNVSDFIIKNKIIINYKTNLMHISNKKIFFKDLNREKLWKLFYKLCLK